MSLSRAQLLALSLCYAAYMCAAFVKRAASFFGPLLVAEGLVPSREAWAQFGFAWEAANGVSKVFAAPLVDASPPALLLAAALAAQGATALLLLAPPRRLWRAGLALWAVSGFAQALSWPALTRVFLAYFPVAARGTWYAVLATSQNAGAALGPLLTAAVARRLGLGLGLGEAHPPAAVAAAAAAPQQEKEAGAEAGASGLLLAGVYVPGVVTCAVALIVLALLRDGPAPAPANAPTANAKAAAPPKPAASRALADADAVAGAEAGAGAGAGAGADADAGADGSGGGAGRLRQRRTSGGAVGSGGGGGPSPALAPSAASPAPPLLSPLSLGALAWGVLSSRTIWLLGLSYLCNSAVRSGLVGPSAFRAFVAEALAPAAGYSSSTGAGAAGEAAKAAAAAFVDRAQTSANLWFEVGGAAGGFLAGLASDRLFGGRRGPVMAMSALLLCPLLLLLAAPRALFALLPAPAGGAGGGGGEEGAEEGAAAARVALVSALYCGLGLFAFPPHVMNGLASRELAPPALLSTAGGFTKALGQLGSALTDLYIARLVAGLAAGAGEGSGAGAGAGAVAGAGAGWPQALRLLALLSAVSGALCLPLWGAVAAAAAGPAAAAAAATTTTVAAAGAGKAAAKQRALGAAPAGASQ